MRGDPGRQAQGVQSKIPAHGGDDRGGRFQKNPRIFHQKFGYGRIIATDGNKLEVAFEKAGTKKVIDSFVELA